MMRSGGSSSSWWWSIPLRASEDRSLLHHRDRDAISIHGALPGRVGAVVHELCVEPRVEPASMRGSVVSSRSSAPFGGARYKMVRRPGGLRLAHAATSAVRSPSIAAMRAGSSGGVIERKRRTGAPSGQTRNFSKFHSTSPASPSGSWSATMGGELAERRDVCDQQRRAGELREARRPTVDRFQLDVVQIHPRGGAGQTRSSSAQVRLHTSLSGVPGCASRACR